MRLLYIVLPLLPFVAFASQENSADCEKAMDEAYMRLTMTPGYLYRALAAAKEDGLTPPSDAEIEVNKIAEQLAGAPSKILELKNTWCKEPEDGLEALPLPVGHERRSWETSRALSDLTGKESVVTTTISVEELRCEGSAGRFASLSFGCAGDETTTVLYTNCGLPAKTDNFQELDYRVDDEAVQSTEMYQLNRLSLMLYGEDRTRAFLEPLVGHDYLSVRFTGVMGEAITAQFDLSGLEDAITEIGDACRWEED
ncbi:hypothetical protein [Martelella mediterranea]|uniref:Uncharacterized protein n=1 Tax=Martelella mediterranea DSM 17316 TaxID=1122214 RepID=A0A1U9YYG6_9HYPH|nr:hypothetical protein [Martelella mediterranea]AQZ50474.1 hypothetical protein Mame_01103 [Martelella mediterranea DSM 17316]